MDRQTSDLPPIRTRRMRFDLEGGAANRHWFRGSPFLTHFYNAMSAVFPQGERFFIDSVRHFEDRIEDPVLREQIRQFLRQEGHHTHQHRLLNHLAERHGLPMAAYDERMAEVFAQARGRFTPLGQLALTCAIEHFTALLGDLLLREPETLAGMDDHMRPLWRWHAVEETEHKAVCYDVYKAVGGDEATRIRAFWTVTAMFVPILHRIQWDMLKRDPAKLRVRDALRGLNYLYGTPGYFRRELGRYFAYLKRDFHPWQLGSPELVDEWKRTGGEDALIHA